MSTKGYYQQPHIHQNKIVFLSEEELWLTTTNAEPARRITSGRGGSGHPFFSPDGQLIAFNSTESGPQEVYVVNANGGVPKRLTYFGNCIVVGWTPTGEIIFCSNAFSSFPRQQKLQLIHPETHKHSILTWGDGVHLHYGPENKVVLCRNSNEIAYWKRYRGGRVGAIWIDDSGDRLFKPLINTGGNVALPTWVNTRIYFISDHQFHGNLYSCLEDGSDLQQHTDHTDYFVRRISTDGKSIVYSCGGDIHHFNPQTNKATKLDIHTYSDRKWQREKYVSTAQHIEHYHSSGNGKHTVITARGKTMVMGNWEGSVHYLNNGKGRQRMATFFPKSHKILLLSDATGEECFEIHTLSEPQGIQQIQNPDAGRPIEFVISPDEKYVAFANHRYELYLLNLENEEYSKIDHSPYWMCKDLAWSPNGGWLAYCWPSSIYGQTSEIRMYNRKQNEYSSVTNGCYPDSKPSFDPDGNYLCFLSNREFSPTYDQVYFDLNFIWGDKPFLVTLRNDIKSPFIPTLELDDDQESETDDEESTETQENETEENNEQTTTTDDNKTADNETEEEQNDEDCDDPKDDEDDFIHIDIQGLADRILPFPVPESRYGDIIAAPDKVFFLESPSPQNESAQSTLQCYDFKKYESKDFLLGVDNFKIDQAQKTIIYQSGKKIRVHAISAGANLKTGNTNPCKKTGWLDLSRMILKVDPTQEWNQMFGESWKLMRDHFWTEDMSQVDWENIYHRYHKLLIRIAIRSEYSDIIKEMIGELGTSHAYEMRGDHRSSPHWRPGFLGANLQWDEQQQTYRIQKLLKGEPGLTTTTSPLFSPGLNIEKGDYLEAIDGQKPTTTTPPGSLLMNKSNKEVLLQIRKQSGETQHHLIKPISSERSLRYRDWVCRNRELVHERLQGQVGYVHVPDMGPNGYAAFHRDYLMESRKDGLIVDFRYNRGGHVSQLLIEKLSRKIIGYNCSRWGTPGTYPEHAVRGPIVGLTNEHAGSDGDIGPQVFKHLGIGTLVGTRSWGGVIGISPRFFHVDGGLTTQPEFAYWFEGLEWGLENHGTEPDVVVPFAPQDHAENIDPQLDKAMEIIQQQLQSIPPRPTFGNRPNLWKK